MRIEPNSEFNLFVVPSLDRQDRFGSNFGYRNFIWALVIALDYRNDIGLFAPGRRVATFKGLGAFPLSISVRILLRTTIWFLISSPPRLSTPKRAMNPNG